MNDVDIRALFPAFYDNRAIRALASAQRWTISGQIGDLGEDGGTRKAPIDVRHLLNGCNPGCRHPGGVRGAWSIGPDCLVDLDELTERIPGASNAAFYLQAHTDGAIVLDIESDCPPSVAIDLLRIPGALYDELSMSGRGFHLMYPLPENLHDFPIAAGKRVLREEHGWYEILLDHWVTFTRNPIAQVTRDHVEAVDRPLAYASIEDLYAELAAKARPSASMSATAIETDDAMPEIQAADKIIEMTLAGASGRLRSKADFDDDTSRWEFSVLGTLYHWMQTPLQSHAAFGIKFSPVDRTWLLYATALKVLPPRPKHAQRRNGRPFLLDRAAALVAERDADGRSQTRRSGF